MRAGIGLSFYSVVISPGALLSRPARAIYPHVIVVAEAVPLQRAREPARHPNVAASERLSQAAHIASSAAISQLSYALYAVCILCYDGGSTPSRWFWSLRMGLGYRVLRSVARVAFAAQMRLEISGAERLPRRGPVLFVSNHLGPTDQFAIVMRLPHEVRILAKAEVFEWPVIGWLARRGEAIPIRRGEADREAMRTLRDLLLRGAAALVFPEGTYVDTDEPLGMIPVKTGAAWLAWHTGAWVVPVAITGTEIVWTSGRGWRLWRRPRVRVVFGEPYQPVWPTGVAPKVAWRMVADEMALRIAALLPEGYRGAYALATPEDGRGAAIAPHAGSGFEN